MYAFNYHRPDDLSEASALIEADDDAKLLAGGMTLLPTMKQRLAAPGALIDLGSVDGLSGIRRDGNTLVIGAMTTHAEVAASAEVKASIPALAHLAGLIGHPQVRHRGTIGGSIANNDPAADYPAALVGLGATVRTTNRAIAADDFFTGMFETALEDSEIVVAVEFPEPKRAAYRKFPNPASGYPVAGVFVAETADGVRVAVTGAASCVFRHAGMEQALTGNFAAGALDGVAVDYAEFNEDLHASAQYRGNLVAVMARRAVSAASG